MTSRYSSLPIYGNGYGSGYNDWNSFRYRTGPVVGRTMACASETYLCTGASTSGTSTHRGQHFDGANYLMCDGHVKWLKGSSVSSGSIAASATAAQVGNVAAGMQNSAYAITTSTT